MKEPAIRWRSMFLVGTLALAPATALSADDPASGSGFTVQGRVVQDGVALDGFYDFQFSLFDAASGGSQIGFSEVCEDVLVEAGLFQATLDFGLVSTADPRWLEIRVALGPDPTDVVTLSPRRPLGRASQADFAEVAGTASNGASSIDPVFGDFIFDDDIKLPNGGVLRSFGRLHLQSQQNEPLYLNALAEDGGNVEVGFGPIQPRFVTWGVMEAKTDVLVGGTLSGADIEVSGDATVLGGLDVSGSAAVGELDVGAGQSKLRFVRNGFVPWTIQQAQASGSSVRGLQISNDQVNPIVFLTVDGSIGIGRVPSSSYALDVAGVVNAAGYEPPPSDARLKRDFMPSPYGLAEVLALRPLTYRWRPGTLQAQRHGERVELGFSAQDVRAICPEAVTEDADGVLRLDYDRIVPVLVGAMQEQQARLDERDARIEDLEARLARLESALLGGRTPE